ncbi:MAG: hypothetical protein ABMB14_01795 [Myxococcota bacterium]
MHDGTIVAVDREGDDLVLTIACGYLRARFTPPGAGFRFVLRGCTRFEPVPYDGVPPGRPPDVVDAVLDGEDLVVWGSLGSTRIRYAALELALDTGLPVTPEALLAAARSYWADWSAAQPGRG